MKTFGFQWHLTDQCNLRCRHCYQKSSRELVGDDVGEKIAMADRIFEGLRDRQVSVNLTGGEPFLYNEIFKLTDHLSSFENLGEINIITNGTIITKSIVAQINRNPKIHQVKVSLEAPIPSINDNIRGQGNFNLVRSNLAYLLDNLEKPIVLMTTLSRQNVHLVEQTVEFAAELGLAGIIFERFVPLGRGKKMADQLLTPADWRQAVCAIARVSDVEPEFEDLLPYRAFWQVLHKGKILSLEGALCNLGDESMAVLPTGIVYPCRRLPLEIGNVLGDKFDRILERLSAFGDPNIKSRLRGPSCPSCPVSDCTGCRALAHAVHGDLLGDDPCCPLIIPRA